jgi:hypothetical protein
MAIPVLDWGGMKSMYNPFPAQVGMDPSPRAGIDPRGRGGDRGRRPQRTWTRRRRRRRRVRRLLGCLSLSLRRPMWCCASPGLLGPDELVRRRSRFSFYLFFSLVLFEKNRDGCSGSGSKSSDGGGESIVAVNLIHSS